MKELAGMIVRTLVNSPEEVDIKEIEVGPNTRILEIRVSKQDVRKLLRNISALRRIVSAAGKGKSYYTIDVVSENGWGSKRWSSKGKIRSYLRIEIMGLSRPKTGELSIFTAHPYRGLGFDPFLYINPFILRLWRDPQVLGQSELCQ